MKSFFEFLAGLFKRGGADVRLMSLSPANDRPIVGEPYAILNVSGKCRRITITSPSFRIYDQTTIRCDDVWGGGDASISLRVASRDGNTTMTTTLKAGDEFNLDVTDGLTISSDGGVSLDPAE